MPARDAYHSIVVHALEKDGWRITDDPLHITVGERNLFVDLGAEQVIGAEREGKRIAVEIKGFTGPSEVRDLEVALGQYMMYSPFLEIQEPGRILYLAVAREVYNNILQEPIGQRILAKYALRLLVFDLITEEIARWIPPP